MKSLGPKMIKKPSKWVKISQNQSKCFFREFLIKFWNKPGLGPVYECNVVLESHTVTTLIALKRKKNQFLEKKYWGALCLNSAVLCHFSRLCSSAKWKARMGSFVFFVAQSGPYIKLEMSGCTMPNIYDGFCEIRLFTRVLLCNHEKLKKNQFRTNLKIKIW